MALVLLDDFGGGVWRLTLNDPDSRNAMSVEMGKEFKSAVEKLTNTSSLRVLEIRGSGTAFSAGGHLDMLLAKTKLSQEENRKRMLEFYDDFLSITRIPVPVVASINGHAVGAGLCLAMACDLRLASERAKLGVNFVKLGLHPGMGATYFLPRIVGRARAAELLYAGKIITAAEAEGIGLLARALSADEFEKETQNLLADIASAGPQSVRELKQSLSRGEELHLREALEREAECQALDYAGAEFLEGIMAAKEKRVPSF
jgi:enoyl-CoA hydratase